jgi:hypothetical protein
MFRSQALPPLFVKKALNDNPNQPHCKTNPEQNDESVRALGLRMPKGKLSEASWRGGP